MARNGMRKPIGRTRALVYAVLVHAVVIGLLLLSFTWHNENIALRAPAVIQAHVIDDTAAREAARKLKQQLASQQAALKRQQEQQEQLRQQQVQEQQKLAQEQQEQQEQQKKAKRQAERVARQHAAMLEQKRLAALKRKQQQQRAEERRKRAIASLQKQLAAEQQHRQAAAAAAAAAARAQSAIARYKALIRQKVEQNWVRPPDSRRGMQCVVKVRLVPGGDVLEADVVQSSGDAVFDRSVVNAVYRASPLPLPDDSTLFPYFRDLEFTFKPGH